MSSGFILFILFTGVVVYAYIKKENTLKKDSHQWLPVEATVASSRVRRSFNKKGGKSETRFIFELNYNYEVDGKNYSGSRYQFFGDPVFKNKKDAEKLAVNFPSGKQITVYYQPDIPEQAVVVH